jgi:predicted DNA-binding transcriptional regulator YafY
LTPNVRFKKAVKSDRLIAVLMALQHAGKESATALAERLEVSVRTIYRDVDALSAAGVPVYAERGSHGGIVLADSYRDALGRFDDDELRALFVSSEDALADIGLRAGHRSALDKLARAMPRRARETVGQTRGRVHVDSRRWAGVSSPSAALVELRDAVWNDKCVTIAYTDRSGAVTRRTVEPFGLVTKAGVWYLVARDRETVKTFRVQRIARVRVLERGFARPSTFDIGEYWKGVATFVGSEDEAFVATFRMSRAALANAAVFFKVESRRRVRSGAPQEWIVTIRFPAFAAALHEALGWNEEAVALEPPALCSALAERARQLAERYPQGARSAMP